MSFKVLFCIIVFFPFYQIGYSQYYISLKGDDSNSGTSEQNAWLTVDGAMSNLTRIYDGKNGSNSPVTVNIIKGVYTLKQAITITPELSNKLSRGVIFQAYNGEEVVFNGGRKITTKWEKCRNNVWQTELDTALHFKQLFVNGKLRRVAHSPNSGFYIVDSFPDGDTTLPVYLPGKKFGYANDDIRADWHNINDVEVKVYSFGVDAHLLIDNVDEANHIVTFKDDAKKRFTDDFSTNGARYVVNNVYEGLDEPGEWYHNEKTNILYYIPKPGENIDSADIWVPTLSRLVHFDGNPFTGDIVRDVHFVGITFQFANANLPDGNTNSDNAVFVPEAILMNGTQNCSFENCTIQNVGGWAFFIDQGCKRNIISKNVLMNIGAGGIKINGGDSTANQDAATLDPLIRTEENIVTDNKIFNYGQMYSSGVGVLLMNSLGNRISNNEIHDGFYTGILLGWNWNYARSISWENDISFNKIYNLGKGLLSGVSGIHTVGNSPGTIINNNLIHDIRGHSYGGWGIYSDIGSSNILVKNNVIYNTSSECFFSHYNMDVWITNNIFTSSRSKYQIKRARILEPFKALYFENNIVYWNTNDPFSGNWDDTTYIFHAGPGMDVTVNSTFDSDWNVYYNPEKPLSSIMLSGNTWDVWHQLGKDVNSLYKDPLFVDSKNFDFNLRPESPAFKLGFRKINMAYIGVRE